MNYFHYTSIIFVLCLEKFSLSSNNSNLADFISCLENSKDPNASSVITRESNESYYDQLNHQWNLRIPTIYPLAYFIPNSSIQVQICVKCASSANIPVIPKSGGHSNEAFSFGNSETIIIDLRFLDKIIIDPETQTVVIETGALAGQISEKLWNSGGFGMPLGQCSTVGIGGLTLGGGYGYLSHTYGLTTDNVLEMKMVDAQGSLITVNETENADLFWALRGVGSGYIGIVTSFKFKLIQASDLNVRVINLKYDVNKSSEILSSWHRWLSWTRIYAPKVLSELIFKGSSVFGNIVEVQNKTSETESPFPNQLLDSVQSIFPPNGNISSRTFQNYYDFILEFSSIADLVSKKTPRELNMANLRDELTAQSYQKQRSFYVQNYSFEPNELLNKVGNVVTQMPNKHLLVVLQSQGGAIKEANARESSYNHRNTSFIVFTRYQGPNDPEKLQIGLAWLEKFIQASKFMDSGETYQNDVDNDMTDYLNRYYGNNLQKLVKIKRLSDPTNYFQNPQSLPIDCA